MPRTIVTSNSIVTARPDHVATDLAGKTALLSLKNRTYYTLDETGSPIWAMIQNTQKVEDIHQMMVRRYDVDAAQCQRDLLVFLQELADQDLIEVKQTLLGRISKYRNLSRSDRALLRHAFCTVGRTRLFLWVLPLERVKKLVSRKQRPSRKHPIERVVWAVRASSLIVPQATCLVQAVALQSLLEAQGRNSQIKIGVGLDEKGEFCAHAWVEYEGGILIGKNTSVQYKPILDVGTKSS